MNKKMWATAVTLLGVVVMEADAASGKVIRMNPLGSTERAEATYVSRQDNVGQYVSQRPKVEDRLFQSDIIEKKIAEIKALLKNPYLAWMFENCFPNTLDTTVHFRMLDGKPLSIRVTSMPCGCATREHRCGPTCSLPTKTPS